MKKGKKFLSAVLALLLVLSMLPMAGVTSFAEASGDYEYEIRDDGTAAITKYFGEETDLKLPSEIDGHKISQIAGLGTGSFSSHVPIKSITIPGSIDKIGDSAFSHNTTLEKVIIGNGVKEIGTWAFEGCTALNSVTIPDSVTTIGFKAFKSCSSLKKIVIPDGVTIIDFELFADCTSLSDITLPTTVTDIYSGVFTNTSYYNNPQNWENSVLYFDNYLIEAKDDLAGNYEIKPGTKIIAPGAFEGNNSLSSVTIPGSVSNIPHSAFSNCKSLSNVNIENGVTSIDTNAFSYCNSLTEIVIPGSVRTIEDSAFQYCDALASVNIQNGVTKIGSSAFVNCKSLSSIIIPDSVTEIDSSTFFGTAYYNDDANWENDVLYIGNHLIRVRTYFTGICAVKPGTRFIADGAIRTPNSITEIKIPSSVVYIDPYTLGVGSSDFPNCPNLEKITVDKDNKNYCDIDGVLFSKDKTKLITYPARSTKTDYVIPEGVTEIGFFAFANCKNLTSIVIPSSITELDFSFEGCSSLKSVTLPNGITGIQSDAFRYCTSLNNITLPNSITSIGGDAFANCTSLTGITIPSNVTFIAPCAFYDCTALESVSLPVNLTEISDSAFANCTALSSIVIPNKVTYIGQQAFKGCTALENISLPNGLNEVGEEAFADTAYYNSNANWENGVLYIGNCLVKAKEDLAGAYEIKAGTRIIADNAFYSCENLTNVIMHAGIVHIGHASFDACPALTNVTIPAGARSIGMRAFACSSNLNIVIPKSVTDFGGFLPPFYGEGVTVYGCIGSQAETHAKMYGCNFVALDPETLTDKATNISVSESDIGILPDGASLKTELIDSQADKVTYDISLIKNGEPIQPNGAVTVKIPLPQGMDGNGKVFREEADGTYTDMKAAYADGFMVFTTDHFSRYILTDKNPADSGEPTNPTNPTDPANPSDTEKPDNGNNGGNIDVGDTAISAVAVTALAAAAAFVIAKKKKD